MIVVDVSAMTEFLLQTPLGLEVEARLLRCAEEALADLADVDVRRHAHVDLLARVSMALRFD